MKNELLIVTIAFSAMFSLADEKKLNCSDPSSSYESLACANLKHDSTDKQLNIVYKKTKSVMSKPQVKLLLAAQKGWIQLRDNHCSLETFADQGTGRNERYIECLIDLTQLRIKQLESTPTDSTQE
jgi:uncharacterized protein YecT (DUF1311 family)